MAVTAASLYNSCIADESALMLKLHWFDLRICRGFVVQQVVSLQQVHNKSKQLESEHNAIRRNDA